MNSRNAICTSTKVEVNPQNASCTSTKVKGNSQDANYAQGEVEVSTQEVNNPIDAKVDAMDPAVPGVDGLVSLHVADALFFPIS